MTQEETFEEEFEEDIPKLSVRTSQPGELLVSSPSFVSFAVDDAGGAVLVLYSARSRG